MAAPTILIKFVDVLVADTATRVPTIYARQESAQTDFYSDLRSQLSRYVASQLDMLSATARYIACVNSICLLKQTRGESPTLL